jgi:hypothetical protein
MKNFFCFLLTVTAFTLCAVNISAQEDNYSDQDIVNILNSNFEKYPWAHLYYSRKIPDNGRPFIKFARQAYETGEVVTAEITKGGWRYELKINFTNEKQTYAKRGYDVKMALYQSLGELLPEKKEPEDGS